MIFCNSHFRLLSIQKQKEETKLQNIPAEFDYCRSDLSEEWKTKKIHICTTWSQREEWLKDQNTCTCMTWSQREEWKKKMHEWSQREDTMYMYDDDKRVKTRMAFYVHLLGQQRPSSLIMV